MPVINPAKKPYKKALLLIDIQPAFCNTVSSPIIEKTVNLITQYRYDLYVTSVFHVEKGSLWQLQNKWTLPKSHATKVVNAVRDSLRGKPVVHIVKDTRSIFSGSPDLSKILTTHNIHAVDIAGIETHDCVAASALASFDAGYRTQVLEKYTASLTIKSHELGLKLLRIQKLTDHTSKD